MPVMNVVALISGGKDSLFNMYLASRLGHNVVAVANLQPPSDRDEMDSYMYQTVGHEAIEYIAEALDKPLYRAKITGSTKNKELHYHTPDDNEDEVEQLFCLLKEMKEVHGVKFDAVSVGAIASTYQRNRVLNICDRLNLTMLAYLWDADQDKLLQKMIDHNFNAILIKVACMGLSKENIGRSIKEEQNKLRELNKSYGANICGEGGEYESLVLDCPLYKKKIVLESYETICHSEDIFAPVYYMKPTRMRLDEKLNPKTSETTPTDYLIERNYSTSQTPVET